MGFENWFGREFERALRDLEPNSTLGCTSLKRYGTTVREFLKGSAEKGFETYDPERVEILKTAVRIRLTDPEGADPIRVFVKQEPHKVKKLEEGRFRLISAVSLVDTMADRLMFGWLTRRVNDTIGKTPCMIGWSPVNGGTRLLEAIFRKKITRGLDMTAWDWTVPDWMFAALKDILLYLAVNQPPGYEDWVNRRWKALFRDAVFVFGDNSCTRQPGWGIMKSGCYLTIVLNSVAQMYLHNLASIALRLPELAYVVLGDDKTIEDFERFAEYEQYIKRLGFGLKDSLPSEDLHFAGFVSRGIRSRPEYIDKHVFSVKNGPKMTLAERISSYMLLYVHERPFYDWLGRLLGKIDPSLVRPYAENLGLFDGTLSRPGKLGSE